MGQGVVGVDLPKARAPLPVFPVGRAQAENEAPLVFDLTVERDLAPGQETDSDYAGLVDRGEASGEGGGKTRGHQFVPDSGRTRRYMVETVVAHRENSLPVCVPAGTKLRGHRAGRCARCYCVARIGLLPNCPELSELAAILLAAAKWDHAKVVGEADALDDVTVIGVEHDGVAGAVFARNGWARHDRAIRLCRWQSSRHSYHRQRGG